jgi:integrase
MKTTVFFGGTKTSVDFVLTFSASLRIFAAMKRPTFRVLEYRHSKTHPWYLDLRPFNRGRKFFKTKAEAEAERLRQITTLERHGREALNLSQKEVSDFLHAKKKLAVHGKSINDAATFYLDHLERIRRCNITVSQLSAEVLDAKRRDGRSKVYLDDLRNRLAAFCRDFGKRPIAGITVDELDDWLRNLQCSPKTRANFRANISVLFGYAEGRRMIDTNPVTRTSRPKLIDKAPEIFSVDELAALLNTASTSAPEVVPMLAIGAFAGLREAEIKRLAWAEIDSRRGFIEVKADKAKTARRRIVRIQPNLGQWLQPYAEMTGAVVPVNARKKLDTVRRSAGLVRWSNNGLRHSFASYRLAVTNDAATVAAELGHSTSQMLYSTYRELVLPEEAERYWKLTPEASAKNVVSFSA